MDARVVRIDSNPISVPPSAVVLDGLHAGDRRRLVPPACRLWHRWGGRHRYRAIVWRSVRRLVFVCAENSYAGSYAERRAQALGMPAVSFGLQGASGPPSADALAASRRRIGLAEHRAAAFDLAGIRPGDLLIGFEPAHCARLAAQLGRAGGAQLALLALGERAGYDDRAKAAAAGGSYARMDRALELLQEAWSRDRTRQALGDR